MQPAILSAQARERRVTELYLTVRETLYALGFADEVEWQESRDLTKLSESDFLREAAWTILCSGFRESAVRKMFPQVSEAFLNWSTADKIVRRRTTCERNALKIFNYPAKIRAIGSLSRRVADEGFTKTRARIALHGVDFLQTFPFVGPITSHHLAKNIGLDLVKPDRHLARLARATGFLSPLDLCRAIGNLTGDKLAVVDIVLWRFATLRPDFLHFFQLTRSLS